jgi:hypothetical protein
MADLEDSERIGTPPDIDECVQIGICDTDIRHYMTEFLRRSASAMRAALWSRPKHRSGGVARTVAQD